MSDHGERGRARSCAEPPAAHEAEATLVHAATPAAWSATIDVPSPTSFATRGSVTW